MKIIFLDIDGVLNPTLYMNFLYKYWEISEKEFKSQDEYGDKFFHHCVCALRELVQKTDAKIVLSSAWRMAGLYKMQSMWYDRELPGTLIDVTPNENTIVESGKCEFYDMVCRGDEIQYYIDKHNVERYVIIDDNDDMLENQLPYFIKTNPKIGLTFKDVEKAIEILNK